MDRAYNGEEVIEMYRQLKPDLILMDISMPLMDGIEATKRIREFNPEIPILAVTSFAFENDRIRVHEAGCNGLVTKPISSDTLQEEILKCLTDTTV